MESFCRQLDPLIDARIRMREKGEPLPDDALTAMVENNVSVARQLH
jgi:hypothetical protein